MPEREFRLWQEWNEIEPFGEDRMDLRFALMTAHLVSPYMKKGHSPKISDYLLSFEPKKEMDWKIMKEILKSTCKDK